MRFAGLFILPLVGGFQILVTANLGYCSPSPFDNRYAIDHAISLHVTNRGQALFSNQLEKLLYLNGISLNEVYFEEFTQKFSDAQTTSALELQGSAQVHRPGIEALKEVFNRWLLGVSFRAPSPLIELKDINYKAEFKYMGLRICPLSKLPVKYRISGLRDGVGFVLEAEMSNLHLHVSSVRFQDLANPFLGMFGINKLGIDIQPPSVPLRIQVPIVLEVSQKNGISLKALGIRTNLEAIQANLSMTTPMIFPKLEVRINNTLMQFNPRAIEKEILNQKDAIMGAMLSNAKDFLEKTFPGQLSSMLNSGLGEGFHEINAMDPPGATGKVEPEDRFRWGITPEEVGVNSTHFFVKLKGFIEDPKAKSQPPVPPSADTVLLLRDVDPKSYDLALAIHQNFMNRILLLSFKRGYFDNVSSIHMAVAPEIHTEEVVSGDRIRLKLNLRLDVNGLAVLAVKSPIKIKLIANAKFVRTQDGNAKVVVDGIDTHSFELAEESIRFEFLKDKIMSLAHEQVRAQNETYSKTPLVLLEKLPLPPNAMGVPILLKDLRSEQSGYIVFYMNFGKINL